MTAKEINEIALEKVNVRVYFNDETRLPLFGRYVIHHDKDDLESKGMVRFLSACNFDYYESEQMKSKSINLTKVHVASNILKIKKFPI